MKRVASIKEKKSKKKKPWCLRWPDDFRDEVLARLLALNAERAEQEKLAGLTFAPTTKGRAKKSSDDTVKGQGELFGPDES